MNNKTPLNVLFLCFGCFFLFGNRHVRYDFQVCQRVLGDFPESRRRHHAAIFDALRLINNDDDGQFRLVGRNKADKGTDPFGW